MSQKDIFFMSAAELGAKIKTKELSCVELTEKIIERIEKINPQINAFCTPTFDLARDQAKKADEAIKRNEKIGLLHGIPCSIKDVIATQGIRTTFGSKIYENNIPDEDEVVVKRLKKQGIILLGKTNTPAFGHKAVTENLVFGATLNPWNLKRTSGGSSGGAAASIVSGIGHLSIGSDGGGSIRIPSAFCGVYGLKPSFGRVPRYPTHGIMWSSLDHYGPIVRYVEDAALMLDAMAGPHHKDRYSLPKEKISYLEVLNEKPKKLKIGYSTDLGFIRAVEEEVKENVINSAKKFEELGWEVEEAKIKIKKPEFAFNLLVTAGLGYDLKSYLDKEDLEISTTLRRMIQAGTSYSALDLQNARMERKKVFNAVSQFFEEFDILITPTTAVSAFELGKMFPEKIAGKRASPVAWMSFTYPFNMSGHPAASIPSGWTSDGLPIGMQIVGQRFDEQTVLQVSKAFEEIAPWQDKKPNFSL